MAVGGTEMGTGIADYDSNGYDYRAYWDGRDYEQMAEDRALRRLVPRLGRAQWFVDFGGGFGRNAAHYRSRAARYVIVDYSATNLTNASHVLADDISAGRAFLVRADLNALPFVDAAFDAAIVVRVLHHLPELDRAMAEMGRVVAGRWLIDVPIKHHVLGVVRGLMRREWGCGPRPRPGTDHRRCRTVLELSAERGPPSAVRVRMADPGRGERQQPPSLGPRTAATGGPRVAPRGAPGRGAGTALRHRLVGSQSVRARGAVRTGTRKRHDYAHLARCARDRGRAGLPSMPRRPGLVWRRDILHGLSGTLRARRRALGLHGNARGDGIAQPARRRGARRCLPRGTSSISLPRLKPRRQHLERIPVR
jgi:SAM-dependent methyltransferase